MGTGELHTEGTENIFNKIEKVVKYPFLYMMWFYTQYTKDYKRKVIW